MYMEWWEASGAIIYFTMVHRLGLVPSEILPDVLTAINQSIEPSISHRVTKQPVNRLLSLLSPRS